MNSKKIQTITLACFMLLALLTIISTVQATSGGCAVKGTLYIDEEIANPGIELEIHFYDDETFAGIEKGTTFEHDGGFNFNIGFEEGREGQKGYFRINNQKPDDEPEPYVEINSEDDFYYININFSDIEDSEEPSKVTGLTVTDEKDGKLTLSWDPATEEDFDYYNIYQDGTFLTTATTETYQKTGLNNGQEYCYKISAVDTSDNEGSKSEEVCATPTKTESEDDDDDNGNNGGGGGGSPPDDDPDDPDDPPSAPTADVGGPYDEYYVGEEIFFDGSESTDATEYSWDFSDDSTDTGETTTHVYSTPGPYTVTLTVTGPGGSDTDSDELQILPIPSNRPENVSIDGQTTGKINQTLNFNVSADDPDGQNISYNITWGDGNKESTSFYTTGSLVQITHKWVSAGVYTVEVTAMDESNITSSEKDTLEVLINTIKIDYNGSLIGYLQDTDDDNVYDIFENKETGSKTTVAQDNDSNYMIDSDDDGETDFLYNETTGATQYKDSSEDEQPETPDDSDKKDKDTAEDNTMLFVGGILLLLILVGVVFFVLKKKK